MTEFRDSIGNLSSGFLSETARNWPTKELVLAGKKRATCWPWF